ncbi:MAG: NAD(P)/FAD-dependent oxidoreductase [Proteobacteria bacterium]|nr:NAD(P)/FAD-dependent oxidoreductase [Pseudomonadota bacterium]
MIDGLKALEIEAKRQLHRLNWPAANWVPPLPGPDGRPVLDVLVVGGGMCGQAAGFALMREGVRNLRIVERKAEGLEGPWATFARMETLRSPKHLTGPDLGVPALTFRAWYEAQHGVDGWNALYKIPRLEWAEYLLWVRRTSGVPVENGTEVVSLELTGGYVRAVLRGPRGEEPALARKVVLALGRDGSGAPRWPVFPSFAPDSPDAKARVFHSADEIDFGAFRGKRVGVLGAGASAFDNAGTALEAGAAGVTMFARRPYLPQVNKSKWTAFPGFLRGFYSLDDARRWRYFTYIFSEQVPPPFESVLRCEKHPGFSMRLGEPWTDLSAGAAAVTVTTPRGRHEFDAVVVATGFDVNMMDRPEVSAFRDQVSVWSDRVSAAEAAAHPEEARFPYLGEGFELLPKAPGAAQGVRNVHVFNWGCTMSHGALAGDIPGLAIGANRLAEGIVRDLFVADSDRLFENLLAHEEEELKPTKQYVPKGAR